MFVYLATNVMIIHVYIDSGDGVTVSMELSRSGWSPQTAANILSLYLSFLSPFYRVCIMRYTVEQGGDQVNLK